MNAPTPPNPQRGMVHGAVACILWGLLPIYWKTLAEVSALEVVAHRMIWAAGVAVALMTYKRGWRSLLHALRRPYALRMTFIAAVLLTLNWLLYISAVNSGKVLQASLGYFINPLSSVALGTVVLGERLRRAQQVAVALAGMGLLTLTIWYEEFPWIALGLTGCFSLYALLRKISPLDALQGLVMDTLVVTPLGLAGAFLLPNRMFGPAHPELSALLIGCGVVTVVPLLLFASATRLVSLSTLGLMQYLIPTTQLALAAFVYHESITPAHGVALVCIWIALVIYSVDLVRAHRRKTQADLAARGLEAA